MWFGEKTTYREICSEWDLANCNQLKPNNILQHLGLFLELFEFCEQLLIFIHTMGVYSNHSDVSTLSVFYTNTVYLMWEVYIIRSRDWERLSSSTCRLKGGFWFDELAKILKENDKPNVVCLLVWTYHCCCFFLFFTYFIKYSFLSFCLCL